MSLTSDVAASLAKLDTSPARLRRFALSVGAVLLLLALWFVYRRHYQTARPVLGVAGGLLLLAGLLLPARLGPLYRVWMALAFALGWVSARVILLFLFVFVLTPIGVAARLAGKRFLEPGPLTPGTRWVKRDPARKPDYEKMY
jgi:Saxitoxin biosynthesis operon protein SxtJ